MEIYFPHRTTGKLIFDPRQGTKHFEPWWALVECDEGIRSLYRWFCLKHGIPTEPNHLWGNHISAIKGEQPRHEERWKIECEVEYWYTNQVRFDNGKHAWLDVFSPDLREIRENLGLTPRIFFHMTLGRLK